MEYEQKVVAYITQGEFLLVLQEGEKLEFEVPKGTIEPGEDPSETIWREVFEETGLNRDAFVSCRYLGEVVASDWEEVWHVFHLTAANLPQSWTHVGTGEGTDKGTLFQIRLVPPPYPPLRGHLDRALIRLC